MPAAPAVRFAGRSLFDAVPDRPSAAPRPDAPRVAKSKSNRQVDFIAFVAAKLNATPLEIAAAQEAARAMRTKMDGLSAGRTGGVGDPRLIRRHDGRLPFPPFDAPTPAAAPADAATDRRYTRTAA